jgi:carboxypeptidase D
VLRRISVYAHPGMLDLNLQGIYISDRKRLCTIRVEQALTISAALISWEVVQTQITAVDFVLSYEKVFSLPNKTLTSLVATAAKCGYTGYMDKYVTYPPAGPFPLPGTSTEADEGCDVWSDIVNAALGVNPAFNMYRIFDVVRPPRAPSRARRALTRRSTRSCGMCSASRARSRTRRRRSTSTART